MPLKADHDMSSDTRSFYNIFGYVWIRLDTQFWIRLDTFWIRILDTRTFFGYATILDTFGYAKGKLRSGIQKYPKVSKIIFLDTFGYAKGKTKGKSKWISKSIQKKWIRSLGFVCVQ